MKKDIFIDTNIVSRFTNPMDKEYITLIKWLRSFNENETENAYLVVSQKLLSEYNRSNTNVYNGTCISIIVDQLKREGRLITISNNQIKEFHRQYFTKKVEKSLRCNEEDRNHIPVVLLSERKYALAIDDAFVNDLRNFPGFTARVEKRPEDLPYKD